MKISQARWLSNSWVLFVIPGAVTGRPEAALWSLVILAPVSWYAGFRLCFARCPKCQRRFFEMNERFWWTHRLFTRPNCRSCGAPASYHRADLTNQQ